MQVSSSPFIRYNWFRGNYEAMESFLYSVDLYSVVQSNPSAVATWSAFLSILYAAVDMYVPRFSCTQSKGYKHTSRMLAKLTVNKKA